MGEDIKTLISADYLLFFLLCISIKTDIFFKGEKDEFLKGRGYGR
jgi:hypothetical protein